METNPPELIVTTALASLLGLWLIVLSWRVIQQRRSAGVSLGGGGNQRLERAIRGQANLTEYGPIFVILTALGEYQSGNTLLIAIIAAGFFVGRLGHGYAFSFADKSVLGRTGGTALTYGAIIAMAVLNLIWLIT